MQTTLRIDDTVYREAKAEAARRGMTLTRFIEEALRTHVERAGPVDVDARQLEQIAERDALMEALLRSTAHFRVGPHPTRDELHER